MQRAATQVDTQWGHPRRDETPRQFVDGSCERTGLPGAADEPFEDRLDRVVTGPFRARSNTSVTMTLRPSTISEEDAASLKTIAPCCKTRQYCFLF
jgi:hypothetical protein